MMEVCFSKKIKINLSDYDYQKDIKNRLILSHFSTFEVEVLEEILFSPLKIKISRLLENLQTSMDRLQPILNKLIAMDLFIIENETLIVDKEMRKYFEFQIGKFDNDFKPDMEFLQGLLRKVPIHILPTWYSLPRSSNNIFQSIIDKYLLTPQIYERYLEEMKNKDPVFSGILQDVFQSPNLKVKAQDLCEKYDLPKELFEEYMLLLEFSFVCCVSYEKQEDHWIEIVTPYHEWKTYLTFLKNTRCQLIDKPIKLLRDNDFAFIEDITAVLNLCKTKPLPPIESLIDLLNISDETYIKRLILKLSLTRFIEPKDDSWILHKNAIEWMEMSLEHRALHFYRHPLNQLTTFDKNPSIYTEKNQREAEKSIQRVLHGKWVDFEEFLKGVTVLVCEDKKLALTCRGKQWEYQIPNYSSDEVQLIHSAIFEGLFEAGVVKVGTFQGKDCFCVTSFGRSLFEF